MLRLLLCAGLGLLLVTFSKGADNENDIDLTEDDANFWRAMLGDVCQLSESKVPLPFLDNKQFLDCSKPIDDIDIWPWETIGVWSLKNCSDGEEFWPVARGCRPKRYVRRQQALCSGPYSSSFNFCPQKSCSGSKSSCQQKQYVVSQQSYGGGCQCGQQQTTRPTTQCNCGSVIRPKTVVQPRPQPRPQPCACPQPNTNVCPNPCPRQPVVRPSTPCACPQRNTNVCPNPCPSIQTQQQGGGCGCTGQSGCGCAVNNPQPCPYASGGAQNAQPGGVCSWMLDPLAVDPGSRYSYLQCVPSAAPANPYCGTWCSRPCAPGTVFDFSVQVCVREATGNAIGGGGGGGCGCSGGGVPVGNCNQYNQCPGRSVCETNINVQGQQSCSTCCYGGGGKGK